MHLGYPSSIPGSGDGVRKAYFVLTATFLKKKLDHMLFMLTRLLRFFLGEGGGGFCHAGYQQTLPCQGLHSVCIWVTLAQFQAEEMV